MKNILVVVAGVLAYLWWKSKSLILTTDTLTDQSKETEAKKETVKEIVKAPTRNNLGMKLPNLSYLSDSIEQFRTNKPFDILSTYTSVQDIKPKVVSATYSRMISNQLKTADRKEVQEIFSRTMGSPSVGRLPFAPKEFLTSYTPDSWGFKSRSW